MMIEISLEVDNAIVGALLYVDPNKHRGYKSNLLHSWPRSPNSTVSLQRF